MTQPSDDEIEAFIERNIDMIAACAERGFSGAGAGLILIYLAADGTIPEVLHASYAPAERLRNGIHDELADLAERANYPEHSAIVLVLPNLEIIDFFTCDVRELQRKSGDPSKTATFYHRSDLN